MSDKETIIAKRIKERNRNNLSLAEQMMIEAGGSIEELNGNQDAKAGTKAVESKSDALPVCWACNGKKQVEGLFGKSDCFNCDGLGFEVKDPMAVIKQQSEWLDWSKAEIIKLRKLIAQHVPKDTRTAEEKTADAVDQFYSKSKVNKND